MAFTKIESTDLNGVGVIGLPDQPGLSAAAMQAKFEETARSVIIPKHNGLIDELEDTTAAGNIGAVAPPGRTGSTVQAILYDISAFEKIESGGTTFTASGSDTFKINAGSNVTITPLASPDKGISISSAGGGGGSTGDMLMSQYDNSGDVKNASSSGNGIKDYVASEIAKLDGVITGSAGAGKTLTAFSESDGKVTATFDNISITKSQVSDFPTLATVATSGSYNDLLNQPSIPTITDTYSDTSSDGMSGRAVKSAIDGISFPVSNAYKIVKVTSGGSSTNITASGEDTVELEAGSNVTLTVTGKSVKIDSAGGGGGGGSYTASKGVVISGSDIEAALKGYTTGSEAAADFGSTANRTYAVGLDSNSKLAVNIPLSTVALTGSYLDLSNKPSIPTITDTYSGTSSDGMSGKAVKSAIDALDVSDSAVAGQYVSQVSETDGKISVTRASLPAVPTISVAGSGTASSSVTHQQQITINGVSTDIDGTKYMETTATTSTSQTTAVTFTNAAITANSDIDYSCSEWGLVPDNISSVSGQCVVTLPTVTTASTVTVRIYIR